MADLKSDLQSYLSTSSKSLSQSSSSLSSGAKNTMNSMTSWFSGSKNGHDDVEATGSLLTGTPKESKDGGDTNGWFTQAEKDPFCPSLSRQQRIIGFMGCLAAGVFCFVLAWTFAPLIVVKPRKFALLYTLGSVFSVGSFSLLWGPMNHLKHLCSAQRLPFTATYFGTMFATLYFSMIIKKRKEDTWALGLVFLEAQGLQPGRSVKDLRLTWNELAAKARKYRDMKNKTGGGPPVEVNEKYEAVLEAMVEESVEGVVGPEEEAGLPFPSSQMSQKQVTLMTIVFAILQMFALVWYVMSYIPGGQTGLKFFTKVFTSIAGKAVSSSLPV